MPTKKQSGTSKACAKKLTKKKPSKKTIKKKVVKKQVKKTLKKKVVSKKKVTSKKSAKKTTKKKVAKKKPTKKKTPIKKSAKKKVAKKKPAKKTIKKKSTKKANPKTIAKKKVVKKNSKKKVIKKKASTKKASQPSTPKKITKNATIQKTASVKKTSPKKIKKNADHSKQKATSQVSLEAHQSQPHIEKPRMIPEDIHPPTMPVDTSPAEFTNPEDLRTTAGAVEFTPYETQANEEYMNEQQKEHFHNILTKWKNQLMSEVDSTVGHMKQEALSLPDPLDRATQEEGFNLELRTRDRERKLIKKIEQSLDDLDKGVYGYCEECGVDIGIRRLEARPTADKCIDCKTFSEIRERQEGLS